MKKLLVVLVVAAFGSAAQAALVGHWEFEDNLNDSSGNAYNGSGGSPSYVAGQIGTKAVYLSGNDLISFGDRTDFEMGTHPSTAEIPNTPHPASTSQPIRPVGSRNRSANTPARATAHTA